MGIFMRRWKPFDMLRCNPIKGMIFSIKNGRSVLDIWLTKLH